VEENTNNVVSIADVSRNPGEIPKGNLEPTAGDVLKIEDARRKKNGLSSEGRRARSSRNEEMVRQFLDLLKDQCDPETFFHTPDGELFARIRVDGHFENWPLRSTGFQTWLAHAYYKLMGSTPSAGIVNLLMLEFRGKSQFDGKEYPVALRVGECNGNVYVDLCDSRWRSVEVSLSGWRILDDCPMRFRRQPGMFPLPEPARGGKAQELLNFLNLSSREDEILVLTWLLGAFFQNAHPILALHGAQGSGKTTAGRVIRQLIDPAEAPLRSSPCNERDLVISAKHSRLIAFDNLSKIPDWLSDALCRLATGSGFATRKLYKNEEQVLFSARRPIIMNGIEDLANRGDLLDRMILLRLPSITTNKRKTEREFSNDLDNALPRMLGSLLDVVSAVLRRRPRVKVPDLPRMADFSEIGCAAERALGFNKGEFIAAYRQNRAEAHLTALDACPAAPEILKLVIANRNAWEGTAGELLGRLNRITGEDVRRDANWPKSARAMAAVLDRAKLNLEHVGVRIERLPRGGGGRRRFSIAFVKDRHIVTPTRRRGTR
jgi:hypothetical protein